jgi:hypothetical protein
MAKTAVCRAAESLGQASMTCANLGSHGKLCVPPCVPDSVTDCGCNSEAKVRILFCPCFPAGVS